MSRPTVQHWAHFQFTHSRTQLSWSDFISPCSLMAVAVMAINDAWLRVEYPSFLTGKISDIAVLFFFPLFISALWNTAELAINFLRPDKEGRVIETTAAKLKAACMATGLIFLALQLSPWFVRTYLDFLALIDAGSIFGSFRYTPDPTDLITLPTLWLAYRYGLSRTKRFPLEVTL